jgi:hypothetical protein
MHTERLPAENTSLSQAYANDPNAPRDAFLQPLPGSGKGELLHPAQVTSPAPRPLWRDLYRQDEEALPSQSPLWLDCLCALGHHRDASRLYEFADGQQLLLPLVKRRGLPEIAGLQASLPHAWGMGGVLAKRSLSSKDLVAVFDDQARRRFLSMSVVPNPRQGALWESARPADAMKIPRRAHVIDLEGGFDKVWRERFASRTRSKVRRAEKSGLVIERDTSGKLMPVFHQLFRLSVDRWAEQQNEPRWLAHWRAEQRDPLKKLEHIARYMGEACNVWVAWKDERPVASLLVMMGHNADYMMGAMDKDLAAETHANPLLQKLAIEHACEAGCRFYHMGESGESAGIAGFKESLGAQPYPYPELRLERFPISRLDKGLRQVIKRVIGFKDVKNA